MTIDKYSYYINKIKKDLPELVDETQKELDNSKTNIEDFAILSVFYTKIYVKIYGGDIWSIEDAHELFTCCDETILESVEVERRLMQLMFNIKHLNIWFDIPLLEGFPIMENCWDNPTEDDYRKFFEDFIKNPEDYLTEQGYHMYQYLEYLKNKQKK